MTATPVRSCGLLSGDPELTDEWWETLNTSLDNLARARTTRVAMPDTEPIAQPLVAAEINRAFPDRVDTTITDHEWVPTHADFNWANANLTSPECWILDWEDHGLAPRGLDAATLWISSLTVPGLAQRVYQERRADLDTRSGRLMALFQCTKIVNDLGRSSTDPLFDLAAGVADKLIADLQD
ncbi:MAG: phosphotransferase [Pseudonocardiaceae bacterium]